MTKGYQTEKTRDRKQTLGVFTSAAVLLAAMDAADLGETGDKLRDAIKEAQEYAEAWSERDDLRRTLAAAYEKQRTEIDELERRHKHEILAIEEAG